MDPRELRARIAADLADDPERQARVERIVARLKRRNTLRRATRPLTAGEQWADFDRAEASAERELERRR